MRKTDNRQRGRARRVLIVEHEPGVAEALRSRLPNLSAVVASTLGQATAALAERGWEAFLVDVKLPDGSGLELLGPIREEHAGAPIVVMTGGALDASSEEALMHRAMLVAKPVPDHWLDVFLRWVSSWPSPLAELRARLAALGLSARETELFAELATGSTAELTALRFNISPATVRAHCARVYTRLGASSLAEVIALAQGWR